MRRLLLVLLFACSETPQTARVEVAMFPAVPVRQLDLMIIVDDSAGTFELQQAIRAAVPSFLSALAVDGQLPDLHIGIIDGDLGTTGSLDPDTPAPPIGALGQGGCAGAGTGGVMRTSFDGVPFLVDEDDGTGARRRNFDGTLGDALSTSLALGSNGCGFQQHLHALRRARLANDAFWRTDASTAVVALVDEDDCSVRDPRFFGTDPELGALGHFRCTRFGIVCDQPLDTTGAKTNCRARGDSYVEDPAITQTALELVDAPERTTFSVIAAPSEPFEIELLTGGTMPVPRAALSCSTTLPAIGQVFGAPAPRLAEVAAHFASRGAHHSLCDDYATTLARIATTIKRSLGTACLDAGVARDDCVAFDVLDRTRRELPRCPADADCFDIVDDPVRCNGASVVIDRKSPADPRARVEVQCAPPVRSS